MRNITKAFFLMLLAICPTAVWASGYQVLLQGNRQVGLGNMGVGLRPDAASVFWNPGGMSFINGGSVMLGMNLVDSRNAFWDSSNPNSRYATHTDNPLSTPFHLYGVWSPEGARWKAGLGVYTPYGSSVTWDDRWLGQGLLQEIVLQSFCFQPTLSYKISDRFSIGGGVVIAFGDVKLKKALPIYVPDGTATATIEDYSKVSLGVNVGMLFKASEKLLLGASYRSNIELSVEDGSTDFDIPESFAPLLFGPGVDYKSITFDASLPMPAVTSIGVSYHPDEKVTVGVEASLTHWSVYEALQLDYSSPVAGVQRSRSPREYENSWAVKVGAAYRFLFGLELRAGAYYDESPVKTGFLTPETPDQDRFNYTVGLGYEVSDHFDIDFSFLWILGQRRTQTRLDGINAGTIIAPDLPNGIAGEQNVLPGTYKSTGYIAGLSLTYNF
ncbi:OmpP1/FadL/TodX family outer membrane transporter [Fulvitalea axinellae]|uniref:OmpP1/FadL/TodX family outer membrane transporter n=1 Tax=Fulvitalea axinellae TaxID=1182444 RepID=A0AAU9CZV1_9BACT|nr:OmpP1/FadL/TodX family outer membrane transporter [Fulvitalea axinellae]